MPSHPLRTSDIANALAVHPNTVRQYEVWGLLPPTTRTPGGYRQFSEAHLDQMRLVRSAMHFTWIGGELRRTIYAMIRQAASDDLGGALEQAYQILTMIRTERVQAETAAALLERWAKGTVTDATRKPLRVGEVACLLDVSRDKLRNWERDGLIVVPRDPHNRYRVYGPEEIARLRVIRTLRQARYSTMAILRMLIRLDGGQRDDLRRALDTPSPDEDIEYATDRWLSTLAELEPRAEDLIAQLEATIHKQAAPAGTKARLWPAFTGGRAVAAAQFANVLEIALDRIASRAPLEELRLVGTSAALLQGAFIPVRDVDLLGRTRAQVMASAEALEGFPCLKPLSANEENQTYTARYLIQGIEIELFVDEAPASGDGHETRGDGPWQHAIPICCGAHTVYGIAPELRLATELLRGRKGHVRALLQYLRKTTCDRALLQYLLDARSVPQEQQQYILSQL